MILKRLIVASLFATFAIAPLPAEGQQATPTRLDVSGEGDAVVDGDHGWGDVHIQDAYGYSWSKTRGRVRIQIGRVLNSSRSRTTGTLYAILLASTRGDLADTRPGAQYRGHVLAEVSYGRQFRDDGRLPPNSYFSNFDRETDWIEPPPGIYYIYVAISEYPNRRTFLDMKRFSNQQTLGGSPLEITLSAPRTTLTEGDSVTLTATANRPVTERTRVSLFARSIVDDNDIADIDYDLNGITIEPGNTTGRGTLTAREDSRSEGRETHEIYGLYSGGETNRLRFTVVDTAPPPPDDSDRDILMRLYNETGGRNWNNSRNWNTDRPLSEWYGVDTIEFIGIGTAVSAIRLPNNNLTGEIPRQLADLGSFFSTLVLNGNRLTGEIPRELAQFENTINPQQGGRNLCVEGRSGCGDDPPDELTITLSATRTTLTEGESTRLAVTANRAVTEDLTIQVRRVNSSTAGWDDIDINCCPSTLVIRSGRTEGSTTVTAVLDGETEGTETLVLRGRWDNLSRRTDNDLTLTIEDAAAPPPPPPGDLNIELSVYPVDGNILEGASASLLAAANRAVTEDLTIEIVPVGGSTSGSDIRVDSIVIESGNDSGWGAVAATQDGVYEAEPETVILEGRWSNRTTNRVTVTIWEGAVSAVPVAAALLLAATLWCIGRRRMARGR